MSELHAEHVSVRYDAGRLPAVEGVSFAIRSGDFVTLTGRSGCGKTTLLNAVAGFVEPAAGRITLDGRAIVGPGPERAVVFQNDALLPWASSRDNVAFALRLKGVPGPERRRRADELLSRVRLEGLGDKPIWELSGGMRQRVGLARALAAEPAFLLMDEPLGALDALTRERMQTLLLEIWRENGVGVLMVTHGIEEALLVSTEILVMVPGPGRIAERFRPPFSRRWREGESLRALRADPAFAALRADLADAIFAGEPA